MARDRCAKLGCYQQHPHPGTIYCLGHHDPRCALADWRADGDEDCTCPELERQDAREDRARLSKNQRKRLRRKHRRIAARLWEELLHKVFGGPGRPQVGTKNGQRTGGVRFGGDNSRDLGDTYLTRQATQETHDDPLPRR